MGRTGFFRALAVFAAAMLLGAPNPALAGNGGGSAGGVYLDFTQFGSGCGGDCGVRVFSGRQTSVPVAHAFGLPDPTEGEWGFVRPIPIWEWPWEDSGLVGASFSRRLATLGVGATDLIDLEAELGLAKRFGTQAEIEGWGALALRWKWFPWNDIVTTSAAINLGLSYASGVSAFERRSSGNGQGSQLLIYLSPEFTFALPDNPNRELVFRMHHRSGAGGKAWGGFKLFNYSDGGSTYATLGFRVRF